jgi:hypothetical protein
MSTYPISCADVVGVCVCVCVCVCMCMCVVVAQNPGFDFSGAEVRILQVSVATRPHSHLTTVLRSSPETYHRMVPTLCDSISSKGYYIHIR